ncbi:MAG: hypothetical protein DI539_06225 [Flavobacterium psychrophilum]|nr:MAG: hypothetical protein DI539_06225 [Flavobacterium psychrophilum]
MKLRQIIFVLLLATASATAQTLAVNTNDTKTGSRLILTKNHKGKEITVDDSVAKNGLVFFSAGYQANTVTNKEVKIFYIDLDIYHHNNTIGCIKQSENNLILILEDGSEMQCFQMSDTDCSQEAYKAAFALNNKNGSFEENEKNFKKLQTVGITKIKVTTTETTQEYKTTSKSREYIKAHFALVAKTLNAGAVK